MKKTFRLLFALACAIVAFSCTQKVDPVVVDDPDDEPVAGEVVTISATLLDQLTKVAFDPTYASGKPTNLALTWEEGDQIRVYNHADRTQYQDFTLDPSYAGAKKGIFSGTAISASSYDVEVINGAFDYASQTQPADGVTTGLKYMASASDIADYATIDFTDFSSVLAITAKMPSVAAAAAVKSVDITASENIFNGGNALTITLTTPGSEDDILNIFATLPVGNQAVPAGTTLMVRFNAPETEHTVYTRYIELGESALTFTANKLNTINVNASQSDQHAGLTSCDGTTAAKAYLIADKYQMQAMADLMTAGATTYFKLVDNIDMDGVSWTRLNPDPYTRAINLDGNNKTISNLGNALFQDFNGTASNLTLDNSTVSGSELLGVFACSVNVGGTVTNVNITNCSLDAATSYCGGLIGQSADDITVSLSGVDVIDTDITGGLAGGIIGYPQGATTISDCHYNGGTITSNNQYTGGIAGATGRGKTIGISDCSVENATISSAYHRCGGAIGAMRNGTTVVRTTVGDSAANVTITMTGTAACYTGGFIGLMEGGTVSDNCKAYVTLTGVKTSIGGFIGRMTAGSVSGCKSYGSVTGPGTIGGFLGDVTEDSDKTITNNESNCSVTATSTYVGGFVGHLIGSASVSECSHKTGKVCSSLGGGSECYLGGFAGYIGTKAEAFTGTISGCLVSDATIDGVKYKEDGKTADSSGAWVGGFAGGIGHATYANNTGIIRLCRVHNTPMSGGTYCGGFAGVSYAAIEKCGVSGKKTVQCYGNSDGGFIGYQQGHSVRYCYSNNAVRHANKSNVGGLIGNAKNTTVEECYSAGDLNNSSSSSDKSTTWGGMLGFVNTVTCSKLIRWNHNNPNSIVGNEASVPADCYVKTSSDSNFQAKATAFSWSTDGSIWNYSGETPALVGMP